MNTHTRTHVYARAFNKPDSRSFSSQVRFMSAMSFSDDASLDRNDSTSASATWPLASPYCKIEEESTRTKKKGKKKIATNLAAEQLDFHAQLANQADIRIFVDLRLIDNAARLVRIPVREQQQQENR